MLLRIILIATLIINTHAKTRPNIIFIIADDLGWNDVGFHGSNQIPTPNLDALAYSGLILNNYYVTAICTPSRSALMTGKYPIHTGLQHFVLFAAEPRGIPLKEKFLPEYLKDLGYSNHLVGKWHLGFHKKEYTPLYRGFDSHFGYWTGRVDYFDHHSDEYGMVGLDMRRGMEPARDVHGKYSTDLFTDEAVKVINDHRNSSKPLFLYLAHTAVHSGNNYAPLPAPDDAVERFSYITNYNRSRYAAVLSKLDDSVGNVVKALEANDMLSNSIIVFTTDNGGAPAGFNLNHASNWPLRGGKVTLWEGGVRGAALIWSPLIKKNSRVAKQMMHVTDWLPTLYTAAGGDSRKILKDLDAIDLWDSLSNDQPSKRTEILHNIDDVWGTSSLMIGEWKINQGSNFDGRLDTWFGPSGREGSYNLAEILESNSGVAVNRLVNNSLNRGTMEKMRKEATISCDNSIETHECKPSEAPCLFNVAADPCERNNLAGYKQYNSIMNQLLKRLGEHNSTAVPINNVPPVARADPKYWQHVWTNYDDFPDPTRSFGMRIDGQIRSVLSLSLLCYAISKC